MTTMNALPTPTASDYAKAYARGRRAAEEHAPLHENPYHAGSAAHRAWSDGHYDACSARNLAVERHSSLLWSA
jgi:hypothetical protein